MNTPLLILLGFLTALVLSYAFAPEPEPQTFAFILQTSNATQIQQSQTAIGISLESASSNDWVTVDVISENRLLEIYNSRASDESTKALLKKLETITPQPATDLALITAIKRLPSLVEAAGSDMPVRVVILTPGTSDPATIAALQSVAESLTEAHNLQLLIVGVDQSNRIPLSNAFHPIADRVHIVGGETEFIDALTHFQGGF